MATHTDPLGVHPTLTANTVDTCTITQAPQSVTLLNRGSSEIYFAVNDVGTLPADPAVGGAGTFCAPAGAIVQVSEGGNPVVVKLISSGTPNYSVQAL